MADVLDAETDQTLKYQLFYAASAGAVRFKVRARQYGQIALTKRPQMGDSSIEVIIGCCNNTKSTILRNNRQQMEVETINIMSADEFRGFWIRWDGGLVSAGRESEPIPFISWKDPYPFHIAFVGIATGQCFGTWKIEVSPIIIKPPKDIQFDGGKLHWKSPLNNNSAERLPEDALIAGFENEPLYVARAKKYGSLCLGKYVLSQDCAYFPCAGRARVNQTFKILCGYNAKWVKTVAEYIPENAFIAGHTVLGEPLYVGRAMFDNHLLVGKVHSSHGKCYLPYQGKEVGVSKYEILVNPDVPRGLMVKDTLLTNEGW